MGVGVSVDVGVLVSVGDGVSEGVRLGVSVGSSVGDGVRLGVSVGSSVGDAVAVTSGSSVIEPAAASTDIFDGSNKYIPIASDAIMPEKIRMCLYSYTLSRNSFNQFIIGILLHICDLLYIAGLACQ